MILALFSLSPVYRFIDGLGNVESNARILLAGFLEAMGARTMHLESAPSQGIKARLERLLPPDALNGLTGWGERGETKVLPAKDSVEVCSALVKEFPQIPNVSGGVSFGINEDANSPGNRWHIMLHRGPLPLLEITISDSARFAPPAGWETILVNSKSAHIICTSHSQYLGMPANIYLLQKRQKLFPYSRGKSTDDAVESGLRLRRLCYEAWAQQKARHTDLCEVPLRGGKQRRFLRQFDELLLSAVGFDTLNEILTGMGTDLDKWNQAGQT
jgi:hypothetical protein